jgi:hypothetical protein
MFGPPGTNRFVRCSQGFAGINTAFRRELELKGYCRKSLSKRGCQAVPAEVP